MGETISYSSGKVPESRVDRLVREARERAESLRLSVPYVASNNDASLAIDEAEEWEAMADALEEKERENERLRGIQEDAKALAHRVEQLTDDVAARERREGHEEP